MEDPERLVFPARYDLWLWVPLFGIALAMVLLGASLWPTERNGALIVLGTGMALGPVVAVFAFPCYYTISSREIGVRCGLLRFAIPLEKIRSVEKSRNPLSAPAPSLRRVRIDLTDGSFQLVSPRDREGFMRAVTDRRTGDS